LIKSECDEAVKLNPKHAGAYHVLGRWHRTVAGFNAFEKMMINTLFGGVPQGGSYEAAIESFNKAIALEPDYLLHKYELALTYYERDKKDDMQQVKTVCSKILLMPAVSDDDKETVKKARELMENAE
jgi:tetratricopeptide (TPR) repeat protein